MIRKMSFLCALAALAIVVSAQAPKIAVLDCTIPKGFDGSVIVPITENIMEELVNSGKYTVLDRNNINAIFKEKEFQLSGEVTDKDITEAGQLLGASFVVVSKMQQVGDTYFLTSKMINITTGAIAAQASHSQEGKLTVLLGMAHAVGWSLATGQKIVVGSTPGTVGGTAASSPATAGTSAKTPVAQAGAPSASLVSQYDQEPSALTLKKGMRLFTQTGLHFDPKRFTISAANYQMAGYLPPGTELEVTAFDRDTLRFKLLDAKQVYAYEYHKQAKESFNLHLARVFAASWDPGVLGRLSAADQAGVKAGKASAGMSRDGVILAMGYPPRAEHPKLEVARWTYFVTNFNRLAVNFDAAGLVSSVKN